MRILPLASDSMGTRSMCTSVETEDISILIDPGCALGPRRYGLPPHPMEHRRLEEHWRRIAEHGMRADVMVVTHYHYDHHNPDDSLEIYRGKKVFLKHPEENINRSQRERARYFTERIGGLCDITHCDGTEARFGSTLLRFSPAVFHGTSSRLGYVVQVAVHEGDECFLFTSDVQGPSLPDQAEFVMRERPDVLYVDGPMTYMLNYRYSTASLNASLENLTEIAGAGFLRVLILDHHLLRDLRWKKHMRPLMEHCAREGVRLMTAAEYAGADVDMLEARRRELYDA